MNISLFKNEGKYRASQGLHEFERALVRSKLADLARNEEAFDRLDERERLAKSGNEILTEGSILTEQAVKVQRELNKILIERSELTERSQKVLDELKEMLRYALHYCYNMDYAAIDKLDEKEQRRLFLTLVEMK